MGRVGSILGCRWAEIGHEVVFRSRNPIDTKAKVSAERMNAKVSPTADAVAASEVIVLAVPWQAVYTALSAAGDLSNKVLLDCTCPLTADLAGLELGTNTSGGEVVSQTAKGAKVVKIF